MLRSSGLWTMFAIGLAGFVLLALAYDDEPFSSLDGRVAEWVARAMPGWADWVARPFSWVGGWIGITALLVVAGVLLTRERRWVDLAFLVLAVAGSQLLVAVLKASFDRARPNVGSAVPLPSSAAFPSGHATTGVACLGAVAVLAAERLPSRRARAWLWSLTVALGLGIGLSRVVLDVHYVTDVIAGWCLGLAWLAVCLLLRDRFGNRHGAPAPPLGLAP